MNSHGTTNNLSGQVVHIHRDTTFDMFSMPIPHRPDLDHAQRANVRRAAVDGQFVAVARRQVAGGEAKFAVVDEGLDRGPIDQDLQRLDVARHRRGRTCRPPRDG